MKFVELLRSPVSRVLLASLLALWPAGVAYGLLHTLYPPEGWAFILCEAGQHIEGSKVQTPRDKEEVRYRCAGPGATTDDDTVDREVTLLPYGPAYVASWVAVYYLFHTMWKREERRLALVGPTPREVTFAASATPPASEDPAGQPVIRCLLFPNNIQRAQETPWWKFGERQRLWQVARTQQPPHLAIDLGADAIRVIDPNTKALIAAASPAEVSAAPETYNPRGKRSTSPILFVRIPGLQPLTITCLARTRLGSLRFSWEGRVKVQRVGPASYTVSRADWLTLVEKCGLAPYLEEQS
jgi:hypothetical protein